MEWCEILYEGHGITGFCERVIKVLAVMSILGLIFASGCGVGQAQIGLGEAGELSDGGSVGAAIRTDRTAEGTAGGHALSFTRDGFDLLSGSNRLHADAFAEPLSAGGEWTVAEMDKTASSWNTVGNQAMVTADSDGGPSAFPMGTQENVSDGTPKPEVIVPVLPDTPAMDSLEETGDSVLSDKDGFIINNDGVICGVTASLSVSDGYLVLPSEGCRGVAANAFANAPAGICEIYIPSNITWIEEGAFAGLHDLEWFEVEPSQSYISEEGILLSKDGTCILAFPAGRTGSYKVPSKINRFAEDAFAGSRIDTLDLAECAMTDLGNVPGSIRLIQRPEMTVQ